MRLHTTTIAYTGEVRRALRSAQDAGLVADDIHFVVGPEPHGSRKRAHAYEIQLGTDNKYSGRDLNKNGSIKNRRPKNTGQYGSSQVYAASYDEWGWFIAGIFAADPDAIFGPYDGLEDFVDKTHSAYN
jgi:hypothetical protein